MTIENDPNKPILCASNKKPFSFPSVDFTTKAALATLVSVVAGGVFLFLIHELGRKTSSFCKGLGERSVANLSNLFSRTSIKENERKPSTETTVDKVIQVVGVKQQPKKKLPSFNQEAFISDCLKQAKDALFESTKSCFQNSQEAEEKINKLTKKLESKIHEIFSKTSYSGRLSVTEIKKIQVKEVKVFLENYFKIFTMAVKLKASFEDSEKAADELKIDQFFEDDWILDDLSLFLVNLANPSSSAVANEAAEICLEQHVMENPLSPRECLKRVEAIELERSSYFKKSTVFTLQQRNLKKPSEKFVE